MWTTYFLFSWMFKDLNINNTLRFTHLHSKLQGISQENHLRIAETIHPAWPHRTTPLPIAFPHSKELIKWRGILHFSRLVMSYLVPPSMYIYIFYLMNIFNTHIYIKYVMNIFNTHTHLYVYIYILLLSSHHLIFSLGLVRACLIKEFE